MSGQTCALLLLEGETEEEFYASFTKKFAPRRRKKVVNLRGNFSINRKILNAAYKFAENHPKVNFDLYICVDQEKENLPVYNKDEVNRGLAELKNCKTVTPIIAHLTIESIFFIDIEGIYAYLRAPKAKRNVKKYCNFRKCTHRHLAALFRQFNKEYRKGRRSAGLINALNFDKLVSAGELELLLKKLLA